MRLISWNVNGIRAIEKKGFKNWVLKENPDILGIQEIKAMTDQIPDSIRNIKGYHAYWAPAKRKGYSGVGIFTKINPLNVEYGLGIEEFDEEGRSVILDFGEFKLYNIYFPNGKKDQVRLQYKLAFYEEFLKHIERERSRGKNIIFCGDVNTAHKPIDLARPKQNEDISGFLPVEREWIDKVINKGYIDTFRKFNNEAGQYSWWTYRKGAREKNVGWRIDYFFVNKEFENRLTDAAIWSEVKGSDHCPIVLDII